MTKHSVLPANKSLLESGLESAFTQLLDDIPSIYPNLLNANKVDAQLLPYLAADRVVSEWDSSAPEAEQRKTAHNAWNVRRLAGTKAGILLGLDSVEYDGEILPWHQMTPQGEPYHFELVAWKRYSGLVNHDVVHRMLAHLEDAKSERDTYELTLAHAIDTGFVISGAACPGISYQDLDLGSELDISPNIAGQILVSGLLHNTSTSDISLEAQPFESVCTGSMQITAVCSYTVISELNLGA